MTDASRLAQYRDRIEADLTGNILPFWIARAVEPAGDGFVGALTNELAVVSGVERGALLTTRILWTYSAAYRRYQRPEYLTMAERAYADLNRYFRDFKHGGYFWSVAADGKVQRDRKQVYGQAFAIYALSEFQRATGRAEPLAEAIATMQLIESHARDAEFGGYFEAFGPRWEWIEDVRLSEVDLNAPKSQNTMLHVMEAYTNLLQVWPDAGLRRALRALVEVMLVRILHPVTGHLGLFFATDWTPLTDRISYGHDIEAAWLLVAAAEVLSEDKLTARIRQIAVRIAEVTLREGTDRDGAIFNEGNLRGITNSDKEWWPQAEAVVGWLNAAEISRRTEFAEAALRTWDFIEAKLIDRQHGEWLRGVDRAGVPLAQQFKVSFWKCPYHNGRTGLEAVRRLDAMIVCGTVAENYFNE